MQPRRDSAPQDGTARPDRPDRPDRFGGPRFGGRGGRDFRSRRKVCAFCIDHVREIDYKDVGRLRRYISERAKIEPRRKTGTCAKHQRRLTVALKNARHMALLPYTAAQIRGS
jgi:small subunit ribosomal protein S18